MLQLRRKPPANQRVCQNLSDTEVGIGATVFGSDDPKSNKRFRLFALSELVYEAKLPHKLMINHMNQSDRKCSPKVD